MSPVLFLAFAQVYQSNLPVRIEPPLNDPVSRLIASKPELAPRPGPLGFLPALLEALHVNPDTQALVFSKTSFQSARISPRNPRAVYFGDDVAIGYVPGGEVVELASVDSRQGVVFYTMDRNARFTRRDECVKCHQGPATQGVPGVFIGSVFTNALGAPSQSAAIITDHRTPFADRWGGWFVDSVRGAGQVGRANRVAGDPAEPDSLDTKVAKSFDPAAYLSTNSDVVALMVFEHQTQAINMLTRLNWESRLPGTPRAMIDSDLNSTADYLLFEHEAPLKEPIDGVCGFAARFSQLGPLRQFDLKTRLFREGLSYLVYSDSFAALPDGIRSRLRNVLVAKRPHIKKYLQ